jgi:hypothetical protein
VVVCSSAQRAAVASVTVLVLLAAASPAHAELDVRDVGRRLGLPRATESWSVEVGDLDPDGVPDVVISYHGSVVFYRNTSPGLDVMFRVVGSDPHDCTIADVNIDGLGDVYCTRGGGRGTIEKDNKLWMQTVGPPVGFENLAAAYRVVDRWGRGRRTTFVDIDHDPFPDLFVGNATDRPNGRWSPNRTFVNAAGAEFDERRLGLTHEQGAGCVQAFDHDRDGWDDLLLCGNRRLYLYRNRAGTGFRDVARARGIRMRGIRSAWLADLNADGRAELTTVSASAVTIRPGIRRGRFGAPVYSRRLSAGRWVAVGDFDGRRGSDLLVVQTCLGSRNVPDLLLVSRRGRWRFGRVRFRQARRGCGDVAAATDLNADGRDEFIVLNGNPQKAEGPVQVLTSRWP